MQAASDTFRIPDQYRQKLWKATQVSTYGNHFFQGLNACSKGSGLTHRIKVYAAAVFGSLFYGTTTYFSIDGAVRMVDTSLRQNPIPSDVGHGGEWLQQPFQYGLAIHMYLISAFSNQGCLEEVKKVYREVVAFMVEEHEEQNIEEFYQKLEADILYLAKRSFSKANLLEIRRFLVDVFEEVDIEKFPCTSLELNRDLDGDYQQILQKIKEGNAWTVANTFRNIEDGLRLLGRRGVGQAIQKSAGVAVFNLAMLATAAFMVWGISIVIDEVFISKTSPESSGHLAEWSTNILTNFFLIYVGYSWTIKREITLHNTRRVMLQHLQLQDEGLTPLQKKRLIETCNHVLDSLAEKCQFNTLPSQFRLPLDHE